ncbi:hypothetical protein [Sphingobium sp. BS19]|uniref:hypothetical protein n=1 Tax=Sphingobium sp. BS19 TaxID=3018973 RepID=UPI0022EF5C06|nr:hypothetical protein [Sphingobium sp. BS19]GLI97024.1 hypothetical protein Sbs19_08420 [Sphingobium sp. BS19]
MTLYSPDLSTIPADPVAACHFAIEHGRQLALDDLNARRDQDAGTYALAAANYVYATLMPFAGKHMLAKIADNPTMAGSPVLTAAYFREHKLQLEGLKDRLSYVWCDWACYMQDIAVGIADVADELFRAEGDGRGHPGSSVREFLFQYVHAMPEHNYTSVTSPVTRPVSLSICIAEHTFASEAGGDAVEDAVPVMCPVDAPRPAALSAIGTEKPVTTAGLIDQWLGAKGSLSRSERSRRGSSARLFLEAFGLNGATADRLAEIGRNGAEQFIKHALAVPLAERGERARIAHIKSFIAYAQSMHIAVPDQDWTHVHN